MAKGAIDGSGRRVVGRLPAAAALIALGLLLSGCGAEKASSPSGVELAYAVSPERASLRAGIYLVDREGGHRTRLTRPTAPDALDVVWWSPTSDLLLFESLSGEVWTVRADGSDLRRIGAGAASWSPDGTMIAVGGRGRVTVFSAGGRLLKTIVPAGAPGDVGTPRWSPDSRRLAFDVSSKADPHTSAIFVASVDGSGRAAPLIAPRRHDVVGDRNPYWSPDGKLLAFEVSGPPSIWTSRADGSDRTWLADATFLSGWAPNGKAVICRGQYKDAPLEACPLSGAAPRPLTADEQRALDRGSRSPDGRRSVGVNLGGAVVVTGADGSSKVVTDPATDSLPEWSRDGERLTFIRDLTDSGRPDARGWVYVVGLDQAPPRRLAPGLFDASAKWLPGDAGVVLSTGDGTGISIVSADGRLRALAQGEQWSLSPDGTRIAYVRKDPATLKMALYVKPTKRGAERKVADIPPPDKWSPAEVDDLSWAADGRSLFAVWPGNGPFIGYSTNGTLHELTFPGRWRTVAARVATRAGIAASPDGTEVALTSGRGLEIVDHHNGTRRVLVRTTGEQTISQPQWSPDGSRLAYLTTRFSDTVLALESVSADGSDRHRISAPGEIVDSFSWRPASAT